MFAWKNSPSCGSTVSEVNIPDKKRCNTETCLLTGSLQAIQRDDPETIKDVIIY